MWEGKHPRRHDIKIKYPIQKVCTALYFSRLLTNYKETIRERKNAAARKRKTDDLRCITKKRNQTYKTAMVTQCMLTIK